MEDRMMKFYSKESNMLALHAMHGHFATSHSHINYYVDVTSVSRHVWRKQNRRHMYCIREFQRQNTWIRLYVWMEQKLLVRF